MHIVGLIVFYALWFYQMLIFGRVILSFVEAFSRNWRPKGFLLLVAETIYTLTDPPIKALRKVIPIVRIGNVGLDLSVLVLLLLVSGAQRLVTLVFF